MPDYEITLEDGRTATITADRQPTPDDVDEIFKSIPIKKPEQVQTESTKTQGLLSKAKDLASKAIDIPSQVSYGAMESMGANNYGEGYPEPQTGLGSVAKGIGKVAGVFVDPSGSGAINNAADVAMDTAKLSGKKAIQSKAGQAIAKPISKAVKGVGEIGKESTAWALSFLNSVPEEKIKRAIDKEFSGKSILKGKFDKSEYDQVGKAIQRGLKFAEKKEGSIVGLEKRAIREANKNIDVNSFTDSIQSKIDSNIYDNVQALTQRDLSEINRIKGMFEKGTKESKIVSTILDQYGKPTEVITPPSKAKAERLLAIKKQIERVIGYPQDSVKKLSEGAEGILGTVKNEINKLLGDAYPAFREANTRYAQVQEVRKKLGGKLKDVNIEKLARNYDSQTEEIKAMLQQLDDFLPDNLKYMNKVEDTITRDALSQIFPGRGGGSGSAQGSANLLRSILGVSTGGATIPLSSPRVGKYAIQGAGKIANAKLPQTGLPSYLLKKAPIVYGNIQNNQ